MLSYFTLNSALRKVNRERGGRLTGQTLVPLATNLATAELVLRGMAEGQPG